MRRTTGIIFALALLFAALCAPVAARQGGAQGTQADPFAGEGFRLKALDGKFYDTSEMKGDVLVVSFGATWCVPCTWELVAIEELKEEYAGKPVRFLWVSIENPKAVSNNLLRHYVRARRRTSRATSRWCAGAWTRSSPGGASRRARPPRQSRTTGRPLFGGASA